MTGAVKASLPLEEIPQFSFLLKKEKLYIAPIEGSETTGLKHLRFYGHCDEKDSPQNKTATLLKKLFPSPDGENLVVDISHDKFNNWLSPADVGKLISLIENPNLWVGEAKERYEKLEGLVKLFIKGSFNEKKWRRVNKEKFSNLLFKDVEGDLSKEYPEATSFADLILEAVEENYTESKEKVYGYPSHIVEEILLSYLWQKHIHKREDLDHFYESLADDIKEKRQEKPSFVPFTLEEYLFLKYEMLQFDSLLKEFCNDPEKLNLLRLGYNFYENPYPPVVGYENALFGRYIYPDCVEATIRNFLNFVLYNKNTQRFDLERLRELEIKVDEIPLSRFYNKPLKGKETEKEGENSLQPKDFDFSKVTSIVTKQARNTWSHLVSDLNQNVLKDHEQIEYKKEKQENVKLGQNGNYELVPSLFNTIKTIGKLLGYPKFTIGTGKNKGETVEWQFFEDTKSSNKEIINYNKQVIKNNLDLLCHLFSHDNFKLFWNIDGKTEISNIISAQIKFLNDQEEIFEWHITDTHASFNRIENQAKQWRYDLGQRMVEGNFIKEWHPAYQLFQPYNENNLDKIPQKNRDEIFAGVLYSQSLETIEGRLQALRLVQLFHKQLKYNKQDTKKGKEKDKENNNFDFFIKKLVELNGKYFDEWKSEATNLKVINTLTMNMSLQEIRELKINQLNILLDLEPKDLIEKAAEDHHRYLIEAFVFESKKLKNDETFSLKTGSTSLDINQDVKLPQIAAYVGSESLLHKLVNKQNVNDFNQTIGLMELAIKGSQRSKKEEDYIPVVSFLLGIGAQEIKDKETFLLQSIYLGKEKLSTYFIQKMPENVNVRKDITPLQKASSRGLLKIVRLLLSKGASINDKDDFDFTALDEALSAKKFDVAFLLLENSGKFDEEDYKDGTPEADFLESYYKNTYKSSFLILPENIELQICSQDKIYNNEVKEFFKTKDVNCINTKEQTPLHLACEAGNTELINYFLSREANINQQDIEGRTPLHLAILKNQKDAIQILLQNNASLLIKENISHLNPVDFSQTLSNEDIHNLLVKHSLSDSSNFLQFYNNEETHNLQQENKNKRVPLNIVGSPRGLYQIDGKTFRRQNVSGQGMRCFFNAVGLKVEDQIQKLKQNSKNQFIRDMIANEIVALSLTPDEIPQVLKAAIRYGKYRYEQNILSVMRKLRSKLLVIHPNPIQLPSGLQQNTLDVQDDQSRQSLRVRSSTEFAFNAFIRHHLEKERMMVMLPTLQEQNLIASYTSIDAIAHINNLNIKVYQPDFKSLNGLRLSHEYTSQNASETIYLYYDYIASHFQAFIPQ